MMLQHIPRARVSTSKQLLISGKRENMKYLIKIASKELERKLSAMTGHVTSSAGEL